MNWPNRLTLLRLIMIPFIIALVLTNYYADYRIEQWGLNLHVGESFTLPILIMVAGVLFIIASITDFLDGFIARKYNQVTDFGKFFDPIADKLLVNSTLIMFAVTEYIPVWMTLILILRDIFIDFIRTILAKKGVTLAADWFGKLKTIFQMIGLTLLFFIGYEFFNDGANFNAYKEFGWPNQVIMIPMYIATAFSIFSAANYFIKAKSSLFTKENKPLKIKKQKEAE